MTNNDSVVNCQVSARTMEKLKAIARKHNVSIDHLASAIIWDYLKKQEVEANG